MWYEWGPLASLQVFQLGATASLFFTLARHNWAQLQRSMVNTLMGVVGLYAVANVVYECLWLTFPFEALSTAHADDGARGPEPNRTGPETDSEASTRLSVIIFGTIFLVNTLGNFLLCSMLRMLTDSSPAAWGAATPSWANARWTVAFMCTAAIGVVSLVQVRVPDSQHRRLYPPF
jgi:hypothetical protein